MKSALRSVEPAQQFSRQAGEMMEVQPQFSFQGRRLPALPPLRDDHLTQLLAPYPTSSG